MLFLLVNIFFCFLHDDDSYNILDFGDSPLNYDDSYDSLDYDDFFPNNFFLRGNNTN